MRVTDGVLPVLGHENWQVETVLLDRCAGLREWIEVRHDGQTEHVADQAALIELLQRHGLLYTDFVPVDTDDGCE